jgi:O-succinylbenzoate synthase
MSNLIIPENPGIFINNKPLFIRKVRVVKKRMEMTIPFETSFGRFSSLSRLFPVIDFETEQGDVFTGTGECPPLDAPWYNYECHRTVEVALGYISSSLTGKPVDLNDGIVAPGNSPVTDIYSFINKYRWIVGHEIAKAGVEGAYWDAIAQMNSVPVSTLFGGTKKKVLAGTSVGLESTIDLFMKKIEYAVEGMKVARIKMKIKPGKDIKYVEAVRKKYPGILLQVDANAAYDLFKPTDIALLKELDNYNLTMIEQPGRNDDIVDHSRQLAGLTTPICLDESILNVVHTRQAIELWEQSSDTKKLIINIKPPRVGGFLESLKIAQLCSNNGVSVWCGGMYESALGKTANVHFSSRIEVNLPGDYVSQAPYFKEDVAESPVYENGEITVPEGIGWGLRGSKL